VSGASSGADWVFVFALLIAMLLLSAWGILDNVKQQAKDKDNEQRQ
jgi:hypothetical protein